MTEIILMGVMGLSLRVGTLEIFSTMSYPSTTLPKTGCAEGLDRSKKSKKELSGFDEKTMRKIR